MKNRDGIADWWGLVREEKSVMFMTVLVVIFISAAGLLIFGYCVEQQVELERRASQASDAISHSKARSDFLQEVLPALMQARTILHSELVQLTGERAEFEHGLAVARSYKEGAKQGPIGQRTFEREQYQHALQMLRLQNNLAAETDRAALRPLRVEAQRTRLRVEADERVVESIFTQQAIEEARRRKRGGSTKSGKTAALSAALGVLIEQYKADGKETAGLELALDALSPANEEEADE